MTQSAWSGFSSSGTTAQRGRAAALGGSEESVSVMVDKLRESGHDLPLEQALGAALEAWGLGRLTLDAEDGHRAGTDYECTVAPLVLERLALPELLRRTRPPAAVAPPPLPVAGGAVYALFAPPGGGGGRSEDIRARTAQRPRRNSGWENSTRLPPRVALVVKP